jgi:hypothetical protein
MRAAIAFAKGAEAKPKPLLAVYQSVDDRAGLSKPATDAELDAVALRWKAQGGQGPTPEDDAQRLLSEVRNRAAEIEQAALQQLHSAMREGRAVPRRHSRFAMLVLLIVLAIIVAVASLLFALRT